MKMDEALRLSMAIKSLDGNSYPLPEVRRKDEVVGVSYRCERTDDAYYQYLATLHPEDDWEPV